MRRRRPAEVLRRGLLPALALSGALAAAEPRDAELEQLRDRVVAALPGLRREDVRRSPAAGLFEVRVGHAFGYVTADGRYLLSGDLVDLATGAQLTEQRRREQRLKTVEDFKDDAIVYAPPEEGLRWWVTIFTDTDCEYCRMLHRQVPEMNRRGIGIRYLFFSKYGAPSDAFRRAQTVWCSRDPRAALDRGLLAGKVEDVSSLCDNPVLEQYLAAQGMGLKGTPAAILPDGRVFYGYVDAEGLLSELEQPEGAPQEAPP